MKYKITNKMTLQATTRKSRNHVKYQIFCDEKEMEMSNRELFENVYKLHLDGGNDFNLFDVEKRLKERLGSGSFGMDEFVSLKLNELEYDRIIEDFFCCREDFLEEFKESTQEIYKKFFSDFIRWFLDCDFESNKEKLNNLELDDLESYIKYIFRSNINRDTTLKTLQSIKSFCNYENIKVKRQFFLDYRKKARAIQNICLLTEKEIDDIYIFFKNTRIKNMEFLKEINATDSKRAKNKIFEEVRTTLTNELVVALQREFVTYGIDLERLNKDDFDFNSKTLFISSKKQQLSDELNELIQMYLEYRKRYDFKIFKNRAHRAILYKQEFVRLNNEKLITVDELLSLTKRKKEVNRLLESKLKSLIEVKESFRPNKKNEKEELTKEQFDAANRLNEKSEEILRFLHDDDVINDKLKELYKENKSLLVNSKSARLSEVSISTFFSSITEYIDFVPERFSRKDFVSSVRKIKEDRIKKVIEEAKENKRI